MKRSKLLLVAILVLLLSVVAACDNAHFHAYGNWAIGTAPTLESEGVYVQSCECGTTVEKKIPALSDESVWTLTSRVEPTHFLSGKLVYESTYGVVEVEIPVIEHTYGDEYSIVVDPTAELPGVAEHFCSCGNPESVEIPALSNAEVWSVTNTVPSTHLVNGTETYTSVYGSVIVSLPLVPHEFGDYTMSEEPTLTETGKAFHICECGTVEYVNVPALTDSVWTVERTTAPDYNNAGEDTYTSVYGSVKVPVAKLVVVYDGKTYSSFNYDSKDGNDELINGTLRVEDVWSKAQITIDENSIGFGTAYPFRGAYKFVLVDAATGEIVIGKYEQLQEEVWVPDEETWDPEDGAYVKQGVVDEDGNPVYDWANPVETYTAWLDLESGLIIAPARNNAFDEINVYTPFEIGLSEGTTSASAWNGAMAIYYAVDGNEYNAFVYEGRAYFGVSFVDLSGNAVNASACYASSNLKVLDKQGNLIVAFAHNGEVLVVSDGYEGIYSNDANSLYLNGCGLAILNGITASYVVENGFIGLYIRGEYHEVTLNGKNYTSVKPMVTVAFDADGKAEVAPVETNKNVAITLPVLEHEAFTFKGWQDASGNKVDNNYVPKASTTLYAIWKAKVVVNFSGVLEGDATVVYLGEGDVIGDFLPSYGVEESVGKIFRGWYLDAEYTVTLPEDAEIAEADSGITIYAKWEDLPAYYGTYKGGELYSKSSTYGTLYTLTIDENGVYTNSASSSKSGIIVDYDPATQIITWKKKASDTTVYYLWFDAEAGILVAPYSNSTKMNQDIYIATKHNNVVIKEFYAVKIALSATDSTRGFYGRVVTLVTNDGLETIFVTNERIYSNVTIKDALGNDLDHVSVKTSKTLIVTDLNTNTIVASVASKGANFEANTDTVDLDAYFGTYVNGNETVVLDGVGGIVYGEKSGTYTAVEGKEYGFDVYLNNNSEYYQLTLNGNSFAIVKPMANLTLNTQFGSTETLSVNINVSFELPVLTHESSVFNGWFYDDAFTNAVGASIVITEDTALHALWKVKKVLTVVYNNGEANSAIEYSEGDVANLEIPVYAKHAFVGWFTTETFDVGSEWENGSEIAYSLTIYAKWEVAPIYNATYASFEIDRNEVNGGVSGLYARNAVINIDPYGHAPKGPSWPFASGEINVKNFNAETGYIELHVGTSTVYWGYIDLVSGIIILSDENGVGKDMDEIILLSPFESKLVAASFTSSYWASGMIRTIEYTCAGTVYSALIMNNQVYYGVSFKDVNGNAVVAEDCFGTDALIVYGADNAMIAKFGFDGTTMQTMDGFEGTYSSEMGEVIVSGVKAITLGGVVGEYYASEEAGYTHYAFVDGCYYEIILNNETYVASVNKPMVTVTFDADGKADVPAVTVNKKIAITLPAPENNAFVFRAWYFDSEFNTVVPAGYAPTENITLYAKWDAKATLTVVYGNGLDTVVLNYGVGDTVAPVVPAYTNGLVFDGWYLDADCTSEYTVGAIIENTTIYCKWKEAVAAFGSYKGFNLFGSGNKSTTYISSSLTVEVDGKVTGTKSGTFTDYDSATGTAKIGSMFAVYNEELGILATPYNSKLTDTLGTDMYVFFKDAPAKVEQSADLTDSGYTKLLKVTRQDGTSYVVLVMNDRILAVESWETTDGSVASEQYVKDRTSSFIVTLTNGQVLTFTKSGEYFTVA